jgi:hypothetical protein
MSDGQILEHVKQLGSLLDGKDTRRLKSKARGVALLVLSDDSGSIHRVRIEVGPKSASVSLAPAGPPDKGDFAVVRAAFSDWMRFFNAASTETLGALKLYGEVGILAAIGELIVASRSFLDVRAGGPR